METSKPTQPSAWFGSDRMTALAAGSCRVSEGFSPIPSSYWGGRRPEISYAAPVGALWHVAGSTRLCWHVGALPTAMRAEISSHVPRLLPPRRWVRTQPFGEFVAETTGRKTTTEDTESTEKVVLVQI